MKLCKPIKLETSFFVMCGLALGVFVFHAQADQWDKKTVLTVNQPIQVTDTYLEPGSYVLKLLDSNSDRHIVQIFNADQSHLINTVLAIPNYRLQPTGKSRFGFWETPPGTAKALRAWFYPGDNFGQEFSYPKDLRQLASARMPEPASYPRPEPEPATAAAPEPVTPAPPPPPQALNQEPQREAPVEIAQNTPAPEPPAPQATPAPAPAAPAPPATDEPRELPKTATPYPALGLSGAIMLGIYAWVRRRYAS